MHLPPAPEVPVQLVDEGSPQTHTNRVQPSQRTNCRITPAGGTAEPATTIWNGNTPCQLFITTAAAKHLRQQQPQQRQPSIFGIQSTSSLQAQPTLPVNNRTPTATGTTAANAGTGGGLFGNTNAGQMKNTGNGIFGDGGGGGGVGGCLGIVRRISSSNRSLQPVVFSVVPPILLDNQLLVMICSVISPTRYSQLRVAVSLAVPQARNNRRSFRQDHNHTIASCG